MNTHWSIIVLFISFFSCQNLTNKNNNDFEVDIPLSPVTIQTNLLYEVKNKLVKELNLNKLENGVDSFELRLWAKVEVYHFGQVIVIKKINNNWTCFDYIYQFKHGEFKNGMTNMEFVTNFIIDTFNVTKKEPKTNWSTFFKEIIREKIYELPAQSQLNGWKNEVSDGLTYMIEYTNREKYKFYFYNCPDIYVNEFVECQNMINILDIFDKEFGLKVGSSYKCKK